MHKGFIAIVLVAVFVGGYAAGYITAPAGPRMEHVTFILNWTIGGEQAGIIAASDQGFYTDEGLSVTILRGYGSEDTALRVEAGEGEFGFIDMGTQIIAEAAGEVDLVQVGMCFHKSPIGVFFKPDAPIDEPKDLEGKTIAVNPASSAYLMFIGPFATVNDLDVDSITFNTTAPYAKQSLVLAGSADACTGYTTGEGAQIEGELGDAGMLLYADYGVDTYANGIIAKESYVDAHPDIVRRFVKATLKGWGWALNNPSAAVNMMLRIYPELERESTTLEFGYTQDSVWNSETQQYGIGYMIPTKVQTTINLVCTSFDITETIAPEEIYTNEFVEGLSDDILFPLA